MVVARTIQILLVENEGEDTQSLRSAFEESGVSSVVEAVPDARSAFARLRGEAPYTAMVEPSLIILDVTVNGSDGVPSISAHLEMLAELKSDEALRSIPVVVVTSSNAEADILNAYSHGACSFVCKPVPGEKRRELFSRFAEYWGYVAQLPRSVTESEESLESRLEAINSAISSQTIDPVEVLVVDDSEDDVVLLEEAFRGCPLVSFIETVDDGEEALKYLRREGRYSNARRPGLVLLDINMPSMNGFEVLTEMRNDPALVKLPVVMLTTSKQESDILRAYDSGACSFISKPVNFNRMRHIAQQFALYWTLVADVPSTEPAMPA